MFVQHKEFDPLYSEKLIGYQSEKELLKPFPAQRLDSSKIRIPVIYIDGEINLPDCGWLEYNI